MNAFLKHAGMLLLACAALVGCGGTGNGSDDGDTDGGGTTPSVTVSVGIYDSAGNATNSVTSSSPGTVRATVRNNGTGVANVVVTFTTTLGTLNPTSGTALTDANGVASIALSAGTTAGAGTVTAAVSTPAAASSSVAFSSSVTANNVNLMVTTPGVTISAGGTTTVTASFTNTDGSPYTATQIPVTFTSGCVTAGTATLSSPVSTINGVATSTYLVSSGCGPTDTVNVSATLGTSPLTGTATIQIAPPTLGSISFVSATPDHIALKGTGDSSRPETSIVKFKVLDNAAGPINNANVSFTLSTVSGGLSITSATATTNSVGEAQTTIVSGTVATSVRVTASVTLGGTTLSTVSSNLVISTGLPDQQGTDLSANVHNVEGWNISGRTVQLTMRLRDHFSNEVPANTAVQFQTEGGRIQSSCATNENGDCTVTWTAQEPRPSGVAAYFVNDPANGGFPVAVCGGTGASDFTAYVPSLPNSDGTNACGPKIGGRAIVVGAAVGEEAFPDTSPTDGRFNASELSAFRTGVDVAGNAWDLAEAFLDYNENGIFDPPTAACTTVPQTDSSGCNEQFFDFNNDGTWNDKDTLYNGTLCDAANAAGCNAGQKNLHVRASQLLIMSGSNPYVWVRGSNAAYVTGGTPRYNGDDSIDFTGANKSVVITVRIADINNNPMAAGTKIDFATDNGKLSGATSYTWPDDVSNGANEWSVALSGDTSPNSGIFSITITAVSGLKTTYIFSVVD